MEQAIKIIAMVFVGLLGLTGLVALVSSIAITFIPAERLRDMNVTAN